MEILVKHRSFALLLKPLLAETTLEIDEQNLCLNGCEQIKKNKIKNTHHSKIIILNYRIKITNY